MAKETDIEDVIAAVQKKHGEEVVGRYGRVAAIGWPAIPSGSFGLDLALGVGGYPRGRIIELWGPEASGKTTLTLHAIASAQRLGEEVAFIDAEHALDPAYAERVGVDTKRLILSQPDNGEQALDIAEDFTESGKFGLIVIDSVAALVPKAELEGDMGAIHVGLQARLMSQALRKLTGVASRTKTTIFFINQIRMKIGVMFGSPETTAGGQALRYYASVRLDIRRRDKLQGETGLMGNLHHVKVVKNKLAPPFQEVDFNIIYGLGIDRWQDLGDVALQLGVLEKKGSWFGFVGDTEADANVCQGRFKLNDVLRDDEAVRKRVLAGIATKKDFLQWL